MLGDEMLGFTPCLYFICMHDKVIDREEKVNYQMISQLATDKSQYLLSTATLWAFNAIHVKTARRINIRKPERRTKQSCAA